MVCVVLVEEADVVPQLTRWRMPKDVMLDVLDRASGERANVNSNDPLATAGNEMRRWLTRFLREDENLKALGWVSCSHNQLEGICNDELRIKLVTLNTDSRAGMPSQQPVSISDRGPAVEKAISGNEARRHVDLFGEAEPSTDPISEYDFLYFCVHASDRTVSAEISRPSGLRAGFVATYSQRVMLSQPGERPGLRQIAPITQDFAEIEKPTIVRKK